MSFSTSGRTEGIKKIIGGKRHDTTTAKLVGTYDSGYIGDFEWRYEELYRKATGEFFLAGEGGAELCGYWLCTAEAITKEQEGWDDEDEGKDFDFSKCPYWVLTTGDDSWPIGYDDLDDAIKDIIQDEDEEE